METSIQDPIEKFPKFRAAYYAARIWLIDAGGGPETIACNILNAALKEVRLQNRNWNSTNHSCGAIDTT